MCGRELEKLMALNVRLFYANILRMMQLITILNVNYITLFCLDFFF